MLWLLEWLCGFHLQVTAAIGDSMMMSKVALSAVLIFVGAFIVGTSAVSTGTACTQQRGNLSPQIIHKWPQIQLC